MTPHTSFVDQRDTHRLIPARFADEGASVLTRLTDDEELLDGIFELDNATNDRLIAESGNAPGIDVRELVFGIPQYRIINASFCHPAPGGSRFNSADRGAWYAGFEVETSQAEVAYHMRISLRETGWEREEVTDYVDYLADFRAEFHDLRGNREHREALDPNSYRASQAIGSELMEMGSAGIVYPCVRQEGGTCLVCFRPVLVINARKGSTYEFVFPGYEGAPSIRKV
jgi:hypothetical protein